MTAAMLKTAMVGRTCELGGGWPPPGGGAPGGWACDPLAKSSIPPNPSNPVRYALARFTPCPPLFGIGSAGVPVPAPPAVTERRTPGNEAGPHVVSVPWAVLLPKPECQV